MRLSRLVVVLSVAVAVAAGVPSCRAAGPGESGPGDTGAPTTPSAETTLPEETATTEPEAWPRLRLIQKWSGFEDPLHLTHAGDGSNRIFVVEQSGRIRVIDKGQPLQRPFLDISDKVRAGGEQGLLSVAFSPGFPQDGRFYVDYTDRRGDTVIARYTARPGENVAAADSGRVLLRIDQPYPNHNGGQLAFGPDGYLYVGMGDGGSGGDPQNNAQDLGSSLGKLLRLDVEGSSGGQPYAVPRDNPFRGRRGAQPEIWAYGLRNPWRFSFDRETGDLWIGDVGQNALEEIDFQPAGSGGGEDYGWNLFEGSRRFRPGGDPDEVTMPVAEYGRDDGISVTGGFVYRGQGYRSLSGIYFYADYGSGKLWGLRREGSRWVSRTLAETDLSISSFGEDEAGEVYLTDLRGGGVYMLAD